MSPHALVGAPVLYAIVGPRHRTTAHSIVHPILSVMKLLGYLEKDNNNEDVIMMLTVIERDSPSNVDI